MACGLARARAVVAGGRGPSQGMAVRANRFSAGSVAGEVDEAAAAARRLGRKVVRDLLTTASMAARARRRIMALAAVAAGQEMGLAHQRQAAMAAPDICVSISSSAASC